MQIYLRNKMETGQNTKFWESVPFLAALLVFYPEIFQILFINMSMLQVN